MVMRIGEGVPEAMLSAGSRTYCKDSGFKGSNKDSIGSAFRCDMLSTIHSLLSGVLSEQSHEMRVGARRDSRRAHRCRLTTGRGRERSDKASYIRMVGSTSTRW
jgi:hypothetical protein